MRGTTKIIHRLALAGLLGWLGAAPAAAQDGEGEKGYVLSGAGIDRLVLGGQVRARTEYRSALPPTVGSGSFSPSSLRARVRLDAQIDEPVRVFLELQESILSQGTASVDTVHQAFGELTGLLEVLDLQGGRFEMSYGDQRMVSPLDWSNFARAWDGARGVLHQGAFQLDVFATQPVAGQGGMTGDEDFLGMYGQWIGEELSADAYAFKRRDRSIAFDDYTLGALVAGDHGVLSWNAEGAFQTGDHGFLNAGGYAVALRVDVHLEGGASLGAGFEMASGDGNPADGDDDTFRRLFNFDHAYQGHMDLVVWQNLTDIIVRGSVPITGSWRLHADGHFLQRAESADALYTGGGGKGAVAPIGGSRRIGTEADFYVKGRVSDHFSIWAGVSQFFSGSGILGGRDQTWAFIQGVLDF